ncbi:MAG: thioredoxin TrxA [Gammaproteobacteria bacterium]|nr:thioredoxin TrxA [Gammaproteobacteria bacterium]
MSDNIVHTSDGTFDADVLQNDKAVLLDFWAEWCGPCKMIAPLLEEVAVSHADKLAVVKLNVDENPNTAQKFGIRSIPTLILIKDGEVQAQKMGAMPKSQLDEFLDTNL